MSKTSHRGPAMTSDRNFSYPENDRIAPPISDRSHHNETAARPMSRKWRMKLEAAARTHHINLIISALVRDQTFAGKEIPIQHYCVEA